MKMLTRVAAVAATAVAMIATATPAAQAAPLGGPAGPWTQTFGDEFNDTVIDRSKWDIAWYSGCCGAPTELQGGEMNDLDTHGANVYEGNGGRLQGGMINTQSKENAQGVNDGYTFKRGQYAEARVYFPGPAGATQQVHNWPAWWTAGLPYPDAGEHDIAEGLEFLKTVYHGGTDANPYDTPTYAPPGAWANSWHVYGVHRKATTSDFYWDGELVRTVQTRDNGLGEHLIFNVGRDADDPRTLVTGFDSAMRVDWVRVYGR